MLFRCKPMDHLHHLIDVQVNKALDLLQQYLSEDVDQPDDDAGTLVSCFMACSRRWLRSSCCTPWTSVAGSIARRQMVIGDGAEGLVTDVILYVTYTA